MRTKGIIMLLSASMILFACKKEEGQSDTDKAKFIKQYGTLAEGVDMKQTDDGGFILLGTTQGDGSVDIYLKKVNAFGEHQWSKSYDGPFGGFNESAGAVEILSNGNYAIVGTTTVKDSSGSVDINSTLIIVTDGAGNVIPNGRKAYNSGNVLPGKVEHESGYGMFVNANGELIVVSERVVDYNNIKIQVGIARSINPTTLAVTNELIAAAPPSVGNNGFNIGFRDVLITSSNVLVTTGYSNYSGPFGASNNSVYLGTLTEVGDAFKSALTYGSAFDDFGASIIENMSGDIVICGSSASNGNNDFYAISFDDAQLNSLTPEPLWEYTGTNAAIEEACSITEVSDGYVLAGYTEAAENRQLYLEKINTDGTAMLWSKDYGFVDFDEAKAIVATSDNGLAVLGTTSDERGNRVMTLLKLDANGNLR